jgi:2'-5' RNA ligase
MADAAGSSVVASFRPMTIGLGQATSTSYALVVIPPADEMREVEVIRRRYDPQFQLVPAHITVVFPFPSSLSVTQLGAEVGPALAARPAFVADLSGISVHGSYVFVDVACRGDDLADLHQRLHEVLVDAAATRRHPYRPHMTVGRLPSEKRAKEVAASVSIRLDVTVGAVTICRMLATNVDQMTSIELAPPM